MAGTSFQHRSSASGRATSVARLVLLLAFCASCAEESVPAPVEEPEPTHRYTYAQHIQPILEARCVSCHILEGIGTFPLDSFEDAVQWANLADQAVRTHAMPPFPPAVDDCAPVDDPRRMPQQERDMFLEWVADGQPLGDPTARAEYSAGVTRPSLGEPTHTFPLSVGYVPPVEVTEEYRCFRVDPQLAEPTRFRGIHVDTSTWERFHQAQVHLVPAERVAEIVALDGVDGRPGWPCYFNPGVTGLDPVGRFLPGLPFDPFPNGTSLELAPGTQFVVDGYLHHYDFEPLDLSVVAWEETERSATTSPTLFELRDDSFVIPAGIDSVTADLAAEVVAFDVDLSERPDDRTPALHEGSIWAVDVHMHHWGSAARVEVEHADGSRECLLDIPAWDEEWQGRYALEEPLVTVAGDRIVATCEWSNEPADQPLVKSVRIAPEELRWGLDELQEMCSVKLTLTP